MSGGAQSSGKQSDSLLWLAAAVVAGMGVTWLVLSKPWSSSTEGPAVAMQEPSVSAAAPTPAAEPTGPQASLESSLDDDPLRMARLAYEAGMLVEPEGYSAWALYRRALEQQPGNVEAEQGLSIIADELLRRADAALEQGRFDDARATVERIRAAIPVHPGANDLDFRIGELAPRPAPPRPEPQRQAAPAEVDAAAEPEKVAAEPAPVIDPLLAPHQEFTTALIENRLLTPADASAKHFLGVLTAIEPEHELTTQARRLLFSEFNARAKQAITALDSDAAATWIDEAQLLAVDPAAVEELKSSLHDRIIEVESARRLPASALKATAYAAPEYPPRALERALNGWVDVEFTVGRDGATSDIVIVDASHDNYFRNEALEAVAKWRFEPRVFMNQTIEQRAYTRIRFTLE